MLRLYVDKGSNEVILERETLAVCVYLDEWEGAAARQDGPLKTLAAALRASRDSGETSPLGVCAVRSFGRTSPRGGGDYSTNPPAMG